MKDLLDGDDKKGLREAIKLGEGDREIMTTFEAGEGVAAISAEGIESLAQRATQAFSHCITAAEAMSMDQALDIRHLRVRLEYSWRAVAEACHEKAWSNLTGWEPIGSQIMGMALCEVAANRFSEDYMKAPWN